MHSINYLTLQQWTEHTLKASREKKKNKLQTDCSHIFPHDGNISYYNSTNYCFTEVLGIWFWRPLISCHSWDKNNTYIYSKEQKHINNGLGTTWDPGDNQSFMFADAAKWSFMYNFMTIFVT